MFNYRTKYYPVIYALLIFYGYFLSLSPYLHHHHLEREDSREHSKIVHSHLFDDFDVPLHSEDSDHHYECEHNHSGLSQDNCTFSIAPTRVSQFILQINVSSSLEYLIADPETSVIDITSIDDFSQIQWEKHVHSASNVSPPLV